MSNPQQQFELLKNNLDTRVFTAVRPELIRQNPVPSELPFISQFLKLNLQITPESQQNKYVQSEKITNLLSKLQDICKVLSLDKQTQSALMDIYRDAPNVQNIINNLHICSEQIQKQSQYIKSELLRFPQQNLQIVQLKNDMETQEKAIQLIKQVQEIQNMQQTIQYLISNQDYSGAALLLSIGEYALKQIDQQKLDISISLEQLKLKVVQEIEEQIINSILQVNVNSLEKKLDFIEGVKSETQFDELSQLEIIQKINYFRVVISKVCKTNDKILQIWLTFSDTIGKFCDSSSYIDDTFIDEKQIPENQKITLEEYILVLAQSANILVKEKDSFYTSLLARINDSMQLVLQKLQKDALKTPLFKDKICIPQTHQQNPNSDFQNQFLINTAQQINIPDNLTQPMKRTAILYRLLGKKLFLIIFLGFQFSQFLTLRKENAIQLTQFYSKNHQKSIFDIKILIKIQYEFFLEISKFLFNLPDELLYIQNFIKAKTNTQSLFALEQMPEIAEFMQQQKAMEIDQQFAISEYNLLYCERVFSGIIELFKGVEIDSNVSISGYSRRVDVVNVLNLKFQIFEFFYSRYINQTVLAEILLLEKQNLLFIMQKRQKTQILNIQVATEHIIYQLNYLRKYSQEGESRYYKMKAILSFNLNTIIYEYMKANFFYLHTVQQAFQPGYSFNYNNVTEVHNYFKQVEDQLTYLKKLSPSAGSNNSTSQYLIAQKITNILPIKQIYYYLNYLVANFGEVELLIELQNQFKLSLMLEYRIQLYYNLNRIKKTFNSQIGHITAIQDLQSIMSFFRDIITTNKLFSIIFIEIFSQVEIDKNNIQELFEIMKILYSVNGDMDNIVSWLKWKANM